MSSGRTAVSTVSRLRGLPTAPLWTSLELAAASDSRGLARADVVVAAVVAVVLFAGIDLFIGVRSVPLILLARALWIIALLASLVPPPPGSSAVRRWILENQLGVLTGVAYTLLSWTAGGSGYLYFEFMFALPFALGVLDPRRPWSCALGGTTLLAGGCAILLSEGQPPAVLFVWAAMMVTATTFAIAGARAYVRLVEREVAAARELARHVEMEAHLERLALLGRITAGIVHEVRGPLAVVRSDAEWLERAAATGRLDVAESREVAGELEAACKHIEAIVADVRRFSSRVDGAEARAELGEVLRYAHRMARVRVKQPQLEIDPPDRHVVVAGTCARLAQVFLNLIVNAAESLDLQGAGRPGRIRVEVREEGERVRVDVVDDGPGVAVEQRARLFDTFETSKQQGQGLGLPLSREYLRSIGGDLRYEPSADGGACFVVVLPIIGATHARDDGAPSPTIRAA